MALNDEYEVNEKLLGLLQDNGKGTRSTVNLISTAIANAPDQILIKLMVDLRALVPLLDEWRKDAVQSLLTMDWSVKSDEVMNEHSELLVSIGVAHACHLDGVLKFFVKKFIPSSPISPNESVEEYDSTRLALSMRLWKEAHKSLSLILDIVPTCKRLFMKILRESYPFMKRQAILLRDYVRNLLTITTYAPSLRVDIFGIIIQELIKIDTTCSQEALEASLNESTASSSDGEIFQMEADVSDRGKNHAKDMMDMRTKLDVCLYDIFNYLSSLRKGEEVEKLFSFYTDFLTIFESSVLPVFSSHHVQFLWFVLCSYDEQLWKHFLSWLWQLVQNPSTVSSVRQNAASYMASYLARSSYLDVYVVTSYLQAWVNWIHGYINNREESGGNRHSSVHSSFYSLCQAVFYVIAFRVKEILAMRKGHEFLKSLNLDRVVTCRLNPLKYSSEKVVTHFANISRNYQFAFCYTVLERNSRTSFFEQRRNGTVSHHLECFFPFDPFRLPKSLEFVTPLYREYEEGNMDVDAPKTLTPTPTAEVDVDDFLENMEEDDDSQDRRRGICDPLAKELMFSYSISPGFKHG